MRRAILDAVLAAREAGVPGVLATQLPSGAQALILPDREVGEAILDDAIRAEASRLIARDDSRLVETGHGRIFLHVLSPPARLIIVGAVHIAEPLSRMATSAGYGVFLVDPRRAFSRREQFRGFTLIDDWPDEALTRLAPDERCAVVTLTHDPKLDDSALIVALRTPAFYIGCLGSRKTHAARLNRLRAAGLSEAELARIHGPVGLSIGARTPAEIAIAILAEIIQVRRGAGGP